MADRSVAPARRRTAPPRPGRGDDAAAGRGGRLRRLLQLGAPCGPPRPAPARGGPRRAATPPCPPPGKPLPIGYHGRAGTVAVSGTPVVRPCGQRRGDD